MDESQALALEHPAMREELIEGLCVLCSLRTGTPERDWEFAEAVHAFIDDNLWDERDPHEDVGRILLDDAEAEAA